MRRRKSPEDLTPDDARATAMRILARREHSAAQLRSKLAQRGHNRAVADRVLDEFGDAGWQSDARFAEVLARSRADQGYGPLRIRAELQQAGVTDAEIRAAFEALDCDFAERAVRVHARRFGEVPTRGAEWQKQYRFLAQRGFESRQIREALQGDPEDE